MITASQIIHRIGGSKSVDACGDVGAFHCWVCGGSSTRGQKRWEWSGANYTGQNKARCPESDYACEACVVVMAGRPPDTERMWSHLVEGDSHVRVNKGQKPAMREFLRREHRAPWFAAIADSGQKHIAPWCVINVPNQPGGYVLFEETLVELPRDDAGWALIDEITSALTDGLTKEEISRGEYSARAWGLIGAERLLALEGRWSQHRGGGWFDLAVWLAQRDEAAVQARMTREKEAKSEAKRTGKGKVANAHRGGRARAAKRLPPDAGRERAQALDDHAGAHDCGSSADGEPGGVGDADAADVAARRTAGEQLALLP